MSGDGFSFPKKCSKLFERLALVPVRALVTAVAIYTNAESLQIISSAAHYPYTCRGTKVIIMFVSGVVWSERDWSKHLVGE